MADKKVRLRDAVVNYSVEIIRKRGEIDFQELFNLVKQKYPEIKSWKHWAGLHVRKHIEERGILVYSTTLNRKSVTLYTIKGKKLKKNCLYCGKEIPHQGFNFCSEECYKELEKIVNFFIPMPDFKDDCGRDLDE